jgi:hypothetical protein
MEKGGSVRLDKLDGVAKTLGVPLDLLMDKSSREDDASVKKVLLDEAAPSVQIRYVRVLPADGRTIVSRGRQTEEYRWHVLPGPISDTAVEVLEQLNEFTPSHPTMLLSADDQKSVAKAEVHGSLSQQLTNIRKGREVDEILEKLRSEGWHVLAGEYICYEGFLDESDESSHMEESGFKLCVVAQTVYQELLIGVDQGDQAPSDLDKLREVMSVFIPQSSA